MELIKLAKNDLDLYKIAKLVNETFCESEGESFLETYQTYQNLAGRSSLPLVYKIISDKTLIGTVSLGLFDLQVRENLFPWIKNLVIFKEYQHQGYLKEVLKLIDQELINFSYDKVYLYTSHEGLYEKYGFNLIEKLDTFKVPRIQGLYKKDLK